MLIAYLIQCHKDPDQINRLVRVLSDQDVHIYIHVDAKSDIVSEIVTNPSVFLIKERIDIRWGTVSQVHGTLALINAAVDSGNKYEYVNLISGQDYPIRSNAYIKKFLTENRGKEFMDFYELPLKRLKYEGGVGRMSYYWIDSLTEKRTLFHRIFRNLYLLSIGRIYKRSLRELPKLYGGAQWFSITGEFAKFIPVYLKLNPQYLKRFDNTGCGDEIFFQTLIMDSYFAGNVVNNNLRYVKWAESSSPDILVSQDLALLSDSGSLFARKIDKMISAELLDELDLKNKI